MKPVPLISLCVAALVPAGCSDTAQLAKAPEASLMQYDPSRQAADLAFHQGRVERDPKGAIGWAMLSSAQLSVARSTESDELAAKSEASARKSLALRTSRNERAAAALALALLQQHRFGEALEATQIARKLYPDSTAIKRLEADVLLELGRYSDVKKAIEDDPEVTAGPDGLALLTRWHNSQGNTERASKAIREATRLVDKRYDLMPESIAWFHVELGKQLHRTGNPEEARTAYERALKLHPDSYRAMAGLTRLEACRENWAEVLKWADATGEIAKLTDIEALAGDALRHLGRADEANKRYAAVREMNHETIEAFEQERGHGHHHGVEARHTHDRLFAMFLADRKTDVELAWHAAEEDIALRKDAHAFDCLAWSAFRSGRQEAAIVAAEKAIATGSRDPSLLARSGLILASTGKPVVALPLLKAALKPESALMPSLRSEVEREIARIEGT